VRERTAIAIEKTLAGGFQEQASTAEEVPIPGSVEAKTRIRQRDMAIDPDWAACPEFGLIWEGS
jgi:hypothetical protein